MAMIALVFLLDGCSAAPTSREARNAESTPLAEAGSGDLTFTAGAELTMESDIAWGDGLGTDPGWVSVPSDHPGRWSYANAAGTCTAAFRGGVLGEADGMDDREATDALLEYQSGDDFLGAEFLSDGRFLLHGSRDASVEHRQFSYTVNDVGYFMAARAFVQADYSVWVIVTCDGEPVGPVAEEVLSKNVIAVDVAEE